MGMEQEKKINRLTNLDNCINLLYGYGTISIKFLKVNRNVSISYMGMEHLEEGTRVKAKVYQSPIWLWNLWSCRE